VGSNFLDLIPLFDADPETRAVVIFCEPGGVIEEKLAEFVMDQNINLPIIAFIAGRFVDDMPGIRFGHAATIVEGDRGTTKGKIAMFKKTGIRVAESFSEIIPLVKEVL
jgi:succinyl-CoA synthetase alpha subunit